MSHEQATIVSLENMTLRREQKAALTIAIVIAVVALGVAIFALSRTRTVQSAGVVSVAAVGREVQALRTEVNATKAQLAAAQSREANANTKQQAIISKLMTCIPELTGQINALSVETDTLTVGERTLLTDAYLKQGKQASTYCQSTLELHY